MVVMTHHAPSVHGTSHPMHDGSSIASAFVTDLDQDPVLTCKAVRAWVFGHTHYCTRQAWGAGGGVGGGVEGGVGGALLVSNQRGYEGEEEQCLFEEGATFDICD